MNTMKFAMNFLAELEYLGFSALKYSKTSWKIFKIQVIIAGTARFEASYGLDLLTWMAPFQCQITVVISPEYIRQMFKSLKVMTLGLIQKISSMHPWPEWLRSRQNDTMKMTRYRVSDNYPYSRSTEIKALWIPLQETAGCTVCVPT
jgi:hypothetical protein